MSKVGKKNKTKWKKTALEAWAVNKLDGMCVLYVLKYLSVKMRARKHESKHTRNLVDICTSYLNLVMTTAFHHVIVQPRVSYFCLLFTQ